MGLVKDDKGLMSHLVKRHGLRPENVPVPIQKYEIILFKNKHDEVHASLQMDHVHRPNGDIVWICEHHEPRQHRDGKPPWCRKCGLDAQFQVPESSIGKNK